MVLSGQAIGSRYPDKVGVRIARREHPGCEAHVTTVSLACISCVVAKVGCVRAGQGVGGSEGKPRFCLLPPSADQMDVIFMIFAFSSPSGLPGPTLVELASSLALSTQVSR